MYLFTQLDKISNPYSNILNTPKILRNTLSSLLLVSKEVEKVHSLTHFLEHPFKF
jgi:hypothetical protein